MCIRWASTGKRFFAGLGERFRSGGRFGESAILLVLWAFRTALHGAKDPAKAQRGCFSAVPNYIEVRHQNQKKKLNNYII